MCVMNNIYDVTFSSTFANLQSLNKTLDWESIRSSPRDGFGVVGTLGFGDLGFMLKMVDYPRSFLLLST